MKKIQDEWCKAANLPTSENMPPKSSRNSSLDSSKETGAVPGAAPAKAGTKRRTQILSDYMPTERAIATIRAEFPNATDDALSYQHRKFIDHWEKTGKPMADWDATWRNWIRTANERGELHTNGQRPATSDLRAAQVQALKTQFRTNPPQELLP